MLKRVFLIILLLLLGIAFSMGENVLSNTYNLPEYAKNQEEIIALLKQADNDLPPIC